MLPIKEAAKEALRGVANRIALRAPHLRAAAKRSAVVIGANSTNQRDFKRAFGREVDLLLETGLHAVQAADRSRFVQRIACSRVGVRMPPLRLLWSGELHTRKALPVLLRALTRVNPEIDWQLDVLGAGTMKDRWMAESERLGFGNRVRFLGRQSFTDAVAEMDSADLFCFTSLRDTSGNVVLEALAAGVPVLCFDHQGCGDIVDYTCGIKIPVTSPKEAYADWARAIEALASQPERLLQLSQGATARAEQFLWSRNHGRINSIYAKLIQGNVRQPSRWEASVEAGERLEVPTA